MGLAWILEYVAAAYFCCYWHGTVHAVIFRLLCSYMYRLKCSKFNWNGFFQFSLLPSLTFSFLYPSSLPPFLPLVISPFLSFPLPLLFPSSPFLLPPFLLPFVFSLSPLIFLFPSLPLSFFPFRPPSFPSSPSLPQDPTHHRPCTKWS